MSSSSRGRLYYYGLLFWGMISGVMLTLMADKWMPSNTREMKEFLRQIEGEIPSNYFRTERTNEETAVPSSPVIREWEPQEGVVIATKIHGMQHERHIQQMLCLLHYAYNHRLHYPVLIFTATPLDEAFQKKLEDIVAPATLTVTLDNPGLHEMIEAMTPAQRTNLLERCEAKQVKDIQWKSKCKDVRGADPLQYNWQAEFRTLHIWTRPELADYQTMLWMDADGFPTKVWKRDPIALFRQRNMTMLFDNFPWGTHVGSDFDERYKKAFGKYLCEIKLMNGHLHADTSLTGCKSNGGSPRIQQIHGFFHITNLDFYRSAPVMHWQRTLIGEESRFRRRYDDQIAVTIPAAVLAGDQSWDMHAVGFVPEVFHNSALDGKKRLKAGGFTGFWAVNGSTSFPEAHGKCTVLAWG